MSRVYETRFLGQNKLYECKSRLNENVWESKQKWNRYECWCECKNLYDWGSYKRCYLCNPNTCGCECNKPSKIHEKLFMWKCLIDKLVLGCENEILNKTETSPDDKKYLPYSYYPHYFAGNYLLFISNIHFY